MRHNDVYRFAGDIHPTELTVTPMVDRGIGTLRGEFAWHPATRDFLRGVMSSEPQHTDEIDFVDLDRGYVPGMNWILDRFKDATGGVDPGNPIVQYRVVDPSAELEDVMGVPQDGVDAQLQRFYDLTRLRRRNFPPTGKDEPGDATWGGDANKFLARIRMPDKNPLIRSFLHELGHGALSRVGIYGKRETLIDVDNVQASINLTWLTNTGGLSYQTVDDQWKGTILEEAVAEGLGTFANRKLGLTRTHNDDDLQRLPEMVAPYMSGSGHSGSAPAAVALELIAKQLGIPSDRYFRMFVDYATVGVENSAAREEVAETIYRGTLGRLTLSQVEELPYPLHEEASLALLYAVEDALDVPGHQRYSDLFWLPNKPNAPSVVVGNSTNK